MMLAVAALAADDPGGWTSAKWGMSDDQILQAIPQAARLDPPEKVNHARVHIPAFDLAGAQFHVYFIPDQVGLAGVILSAKEPDEGLDALFRHLQELLVQKYGRPWTAGVDQTTDLQWSLPTTTITLSMVRIPAIKMQMLSLSYKKKSADLDKL